MRCGFVALVGAPNVGKSTLLNRMVGTKLSIVSPKAQTTRIRVLGIVMHHEAQILLMDTPGIFSPKRKLDEAMVAAAWTGVSESDLTLLLIDVSVGLTEEGLSEENKKIIDKLKEAPRRIWLVLNKIDRVAAQVLLPLTEFINNQLPIESTFMVSAKTGSGVEDLLDQLAEALPEEHWLYPEDDLTNLPERLLAAELVREQIFLQTHKEIPYAATVETENFEERSDGSVRIDATIYVAKLNHKGILVGEGGQRIRKIGEQARKEISRLLDRPCHLFLMVKERKGWDNEKARLRALGLDSP